LTYSLDDVSILTKDKENNMTAKQKKAYMKDPNKCPYCKSENLKTGTPEADTEVGLSEVGRAILIEVECEDCHSVWNDLYELVDVEAHK
jgi:uncharacterized protein with PIN domain